jgi:hypothetical protein
MPVPADPEAITTGPVGPVSGRRPRRCGRAGLAALLALAATIAVLLTACGSGHGAAGSAASQASSGGSVTSATATTGSAVVATADQADATIRPDEHVTPVPHSFLGLSTEYWTLPVDELHIRLYKRILSQLHVTGDGRFILRIGGDSSDHAVWDPNSAKLPPWAFEVTPALVRRTAKIISQMSLRVIVDLNTITTDPRLAADWASAARKRLPPGSLIGFEIGNEPDLYSRAVWVHQLQNTGFDLAKLPAQITPQGYVHDYNAFAKAIIAAVPGVPLLAPALANPARDFDWLTTLLANPHPGLRFITVHRYPLSACAKPGQPTYPTVQKVLSERTTAGMAASTKKAVALGRKNGLPVRLTEINSVTCGGLRGVSNTFATALWAPDALFELVRAGAIGVNLHARVFSINAPFRFTLRGIRARPLLYGLIAFKRMLGPDSRLVPVEMRSPASLHLKVWAVRVSTNTLNVMVINKGGRTATIGLHLPSTSPATVRRLIAPSASSQHHVTLGGQRLTDQVVWHGRPTSETVSPSGGRYSIRVRRQSAAIVTVHVASSALAG